MAIPAPLTCLYPFLCSSPAEPLLQPHCLLCSPTRCHCSKAALGSSGASYSRKVIRTALPHGRHVCMEVITSLSLNNPIHCKGELFSSNTFCVCVPNNLDIKQLEPLWMSGMSSDPDLVKEGRTLPSMLTW